MFASSIEVVLTKFCRFENCTFVDARVASKLLKIVKIFKFEVFQASSASHGMVAQTLVVTRRAEILLFSKSNYSARHIGQGSEWSEIEIFDM